MSALEPPDTSEASWQQVEDLLSSLHELARAEWLRAQRHDERLELGAIQAEEIGARVPGRVAGHGR